MSATTNPTTGDRAGASLSPYAPRAPIDWARVGAYIAVLALTVVYLGPLLMLLNTAFLTPAEFIRSPMTLPSSISLDNFFEAWDRASFARYLLNSVIYVVVSTTVFVITGTFLSVAIARRFVRGGGLMFTLFLIALFLPPALIPQFQLILRLGLFNNPIGYIMLFVVNPIGIVILVNYIRTIPIELDEAAAIEGAGYLRYVFQIVMPLAKPAIATVAVLHSIGVWNELILPTIYLTSEEFYPVTRGLIVFQGVYGNNWPLLAAGVLMIALPMVVFFIFMQRYIIGGVTAGAVKG
jgi:raffinose/stachyose/melibiose transport system permease protein